MPGSVFNNNVTISMRKFFQFLLRVGCWPIYTVVKGSVLTVPAYY